jgi:uncharacterized protein YecE (DUF72 family)
MMTGQIFVGTAGWSYKDWKEHFYPEDLAEGDWLRFYAQYFNTVEVNVTYYTHVAQSMVEGWLRKTESNPDFKFIIKLHQAFTHKRTYTAEDVARVQATLDILLRSEKCLGILLQFPYSFPCTDQGMRFVRKITEELYSPNYFLEVRHKSWSGKNVSTLIDNENLSVCWIDQPQLGETIDWLPDKETEKLYLRLHGRNEKAWRESLQNFGKKQTYEEQSSRYNYLYSRGELIEFVQIIKNTFKQLKELIVIANNHPNGNAIMNAFELLEFLKGTVKIPETTDALMKKLQRRA